MCISITEADPIHISMHSQRYDTYEAASDAIHPYYDSIQHNAIRCNGKNMIYIISLVQTDSKS